METVVLSPTAGNIGRVAAALKRGELAAIPTETVYGLAGAAFDEAAIGAIFDVKTRPTFDPIIVHAARPDGWEAFDGEGVWRLLEQSGLVTAAPLDPGERRVAARLALAFWPGPLTLVLPRGPRVPDLVTSGLPTVAVRMPAHPVAQAVLAATGLPLAAPSANRFGRISPTTAEAVVAELGGRIPFVVDGGPCRVGIESTVLAIGEGLELLRPGGISREAIEAAARTEVRVAPPVARIGSVAPSPGMLASHYAPSKAVFLLDGPARSLSERDAGKVRAAIPENVVEVGLLVAQDDPHEAARAFERACGRPVHAIALSRSGSSQEAARSLFSSLRRLDDSTVGFIVVEPWPDTEGLGHAIADRLRRAAATRP